MRRFSLIGRLGPDDKTAVVPVQRDSVVLAIDFLNAQRRLGFGIGQAFQDLRVLGLRVRETAVDLVVLAALVNAGDTRVSRSRNAQDGWTREIDLYAPVSDPEAWTAATPDVESLLRFLTGDRRRLVFRHRPERLSSIVRPILGRPLPDLDEVSLLSGGLDSFIGAIDLLAEGRRPLFVSHYWDGETSKAQTALLEALRKRFPETKLKSMRVRLGFDKHDLRTEEIEDTQRGRSFLFYSLASLAASGFDGPVQVNIPENGLIALNVPLVLAAA